MNKTVKGDTTDLMNKKALKTLEFDKIIHILTAHAASEGAKEMCRKLVPYDNINDVERAQRETADALRRVYRQRKRFLWRDT